LLVRNYWQGSKYKQSRKFDRIFQSRREQAITYSHLKFDFY